MTKCYIFYDLALRVSSDIVEATMTIQQGDGEAATEAPAVETAALET